MKKYLKTLAVFIFALSLSSCFKISSKNEEKEVSKGKAQKILEDLFKKNNADVTIKKIEEKHGVYWVTSIYEGQNYETQLSKDGEVFFNQYLFLDDKEAEADAIKKKAVAQKKEIDAIDVPKQDKPVVEIFVVSNCPFGIQIEKGIIPVVKKLGDKAEIKIKFITGVMHGDAEYDENLRQYCIRENYPDKFYPYLECFLNSGDYGKCFDSENIDKVAVEKCEQDTQTKIKADRSTNYLPLDKIDADKYAAEASPTFVINEKVISPPRNPMGLLDVICKGFNNPPDECKNNDLSIIEPSATFGA